MTAGLAYQTQYTVPLIGSKSGTTVTPSTLTAAYTGNTKTIATGGMSVITIDVKYTTGSGETNNSIDIQMEHSSDGTNFYTLTNESSSSGVSTITQRNLTLVGAAAATAYAFSYKMDINYKFMKFSAKESGVAANFGTCYMEVTFGGH